MAYAAVVTPTVDIVQLRRNLLVTVAETEGAVGSEWSLAIGAYIPSGKFKVVRVKVVKTSGTEATVAPVFGTATNPTDGTIAYGGGLVAAASQDSNNSGNGWCCYGTTLYGRTVPNAGADNVNTSHFYIVEGWA